MEIVQNKKGDVTLLSLKGRFGPTTTPKVEEKITALINEGEKKLALDFTDLDYINSAGLRVILSATKNLKKSGGKFILFGMKDHIKEVFDMTGFTSIMTIAGTEEEALSQF